MAYSTGNFYRKKITINTTTATPALYPVKLTIAFVTGKMNADFSDLRFVTKTDVLLDYWIESKTDSSTATVWVELADAIGASSSDYIYMHYGNPSLASLSNITNTFLFGDDFSTAWNNPVKWTGSTALGTVSGGILTATRAGADGNIIGNSFQAGDIKVRFRATIPDLNYFLVGAQSDGAAQYANIQHSSGYANHSAWYCVNTGTSTTYTTNIGVGAYHIYTITRFTTGTDTLKFYLDDDTLVATIADATVPALALAPNIGLYTSNGSLLVDWVFVTKCVATEPTSTTGAEEHTRKGGIIFY